MIDVIIRKDKNGNYSDFSVSGHAGFAQAVNSDKDLVCASVSVLVINTINALEKLTDIGMKVDSDEKKGIIECRFSDIPNESEKVLVDAMVLGISSIESEYGTRFCRLRFEEV
ncbi:MAG: ribosomal-processing cysteine protease Prp [Lachnospiraceae bacterium]|nr:ribosomal-processing cysteine protease Prp [Lachnospiraceae bacterium]